MKQLLFAITMIMTLAVGTRAEGVLIVADEIPAMEVLAKALKDQEGVNAEIVTQDEMPESLTRYDAVIVYIHMELKAGPEKAFIDYTKAGGKLICLHHSISSMKRANENWFSFLNIELPKKEAGDGAYQYVGNISMEIINLAPNHFITKNKIGYRNKIPYIRETDKKEKTFPGFALENTEGFLNHKLIGARTVLLGYKFKDKEGRLWMQDRAAWCMPVEKGWVFYSQPGHAISDFEDPIYARIIINAVIFKF